MRNNFKNKCGLKKTETDVAIKFEFVFFRTIFYLVNLKTFC